MRLAALCLLLTGCATTTTGPSPLGVDLALQRADELNGQMLSIKGVMGPCDLSGCRVAEQGSDGSLFIRVGGDAGFASAARAAFGKTVVVRGRVDSSCIRGSSPPPPGTGIVACAGVGTPIRDARIVTIR